MCCHKKEESQSEESQCCFIEHKEKVIPCVLGVFAAFFVIVGFILGHKFLCKKDSDEF
ncbi:hypothetical protein [Acetobacterium tundrae]|uniref:Uncharacterized protein n=1 Tax=Acetobacterium tundrae TaxID=132932 RepID=A0ABR6WG98_9FIRM|nr:hypothetical protein [Acetobacterium tundrae]MBC3795540.1 hypothetical protein [Acetobacterium tundrae]